MTHEGTHNQATAPALRALLSEASEHRRRGDHGAACYLETLAAIALRGALAAEPMEAQQ